MPTRRIADGIRKFSTQVHAEHEQLFANLVGGQSPEVMLITCSDSRIDPAMVTQTLPGELFVLRNAGNIVGSYDTDGDAQAGAIEFAIKALGVKHIVVCGHTHCGAMGAVLDPASVDALPAVAAWLRKAGPRRAPGAAPSVDDQVRFNVVEQLDNLRTHPAVHEAESNSNLKLHGWVYDFASGEVAELRPRSGEFVTMKAATANTASNQGV